MFLQPLLDYFARQRRQYSFYGGGTGADAALYQPRQTNPSLPVPSVGPVQSQAAMAPTQPTPVGAAGAQTTKRKQGFGPIGSASAPSGGG